MAENEVVFERPDQHHAFKRGYRLALQKQPIINMPSYIRRDDELRHFFEQGWFQAQDEIQAGMTLNKNPNLRYRATWIVMTALAGAATAALIIKDSNHFSLGDLDNLLQRAPAPTTTLTSELSSAPASLVAGDNNALALLSASERQDLTELNVNERLLSEPVTRQHIVPSSAVFSTSLSASSDAEQTFQQGSNVPKFIRHVRFNLNASQLSTEKITLRWLWQNRIVQTQSQKTTESTVNMSSSQPLYSAWKGNWDIEILDHQQNVIYRYSFIYGHE